MNWAHDPQARGLNTCPATTRAVRALKNQIARGHSAHSRRGNIAPAASCAQSHLARGALATVSVRDDCIATTPQVHAEELRAQGGSRNTYVADAAAAAAAAPQTTNNT